MRDAPSSSKTSTGSPISTHFCQHDRCDRKQPTIPRVMSKRPNAVTFCFICSSVSSLPSHAGARRKRTFCTSNCSLTDS